MKFDSFSRFLKSELYNESLKAEISGKPMRFDTDGNWLKNDKSSIEVNFQFQMLDSSKVKFCFEN